MLRVTLKEYRTSHAVLLTEEQLQTIRRLLPSVTVQPSVGGARLFDLTPGSIVGTVRMEDMELTILPKIPVERLMFLLSYAIDTADWEDRVSSFGTDSGVLESVVHGFVFLSRRAFRKGLLEGYRTEEDALPGVRGRIRFEDQIRRRYGIFPPVEVRYEDFTPDIEANRLIKAAAYRLSRMRIRSPQALAMLQSLSLILAPVTLVDYPSFIPEISYDRLNSHYQPAVELARLVLKSASVEFRQGSVRSASFLVDMNQLFEDFVVTSLREGVRASSREFPQNARGRRLYLDDDERNRLEPDFSYWDGTICRVVGDVKYKRTTLTGIGNPDLYQLFAYVTASGVETGLLIYAAGESKPETYSISRAGKTLEVFVLDLEGEPSRILEQIDGIARRIRDISEKEREDTGERISIV